MCTDERAFLAAYTPGDHVKAVLKALSATLCGHTMSNAFCEPSCQERFVLMFCRVRLLWHLQLENRELRKVPSRMMTVEARRAQKLEATFNFINDQET